MIDLVYTDPDGVEQGVIAAYRLDLAYGSDENDFELTLPAGMRLAEKSRVYIDGTEWGGIVRGGRESTLGALPVFVATGETWHGKLASTYVCPAAAHFDVSGEAHAAMREVVSFTGLGGVFDVSGEDSGITVDHRFDRFVDVYSGMRKMLAASGAKLKIDKQPGAKPTLHAAPLGDYVDTDEANRYGYELSWSTPVNHLICLGMGELEERTVLHLYADAYGNVSQTQTLFGLDERQAKYDYNNVEEDKLLEEGKNKLSEMQQVSTVELSLPEGAAYDVGDVVGVSSEKTGVSVVSTVTKVIVKVSDDGRVEVSNEVGEIAASSAYAGGSSGFGGGIVYKAGRGIVIGGSTISAEVSQKDLDGKAAASHFHSWDAVTGKPKEFPPSEHSHGWDSVTGKPETFSPSEHGHDDRYYTESEVDTKLRGKSDTSHSHEWADIGSKPASFPPEAHVHGWAEVHGKPDAFPPVDHSHQWGSITEKPDTFEPKDHTHAVATKDADGFMSAADKAVIESLSGGSVTGVKGESESAYRTGNVNITAEDVRAFSSSVEVVGDMSLANLLSLPAGAYLVSSDAVGSPCPGSYGNMILSHAMPDGWTGRVNAIVAFDNGGVRVAVGGDWENGFYWRAVDNYLPSMSGVLPISLGGTDATTGANARINLGAAGADTSNGWCKITFPNGSQSGWLQTTQNGILPYSANGSNVGSWDYQFRDVWANHMHTLGGDVYGATVAYSNDYGTNGTVTLSQSVEGVKRMEIYTRDNDWVRDCASLFYPQGCVAALCISSKTPTGSFWEKKSVVLVSGNAITVQRAGCVDGSGNSQGDANTNNIFITRVVLYNN